MTPGWIELHDKEGYRILVRCESVYRVHEDPDLLKVYGSNVRALLCFSDGATPVTESYDEVVSYLAGHV